LVAGEVVVLIRDVVPDTVNEVALDVRTIVSDVADATEPNAEVAVLS
jgi:hypothetical protein